MCFTRVDEEEGGGVRGEGKGGGVNVFLTPNTYGWHFCRW